MLIWDHPGAPREVCARRRGLTTEDSPQRHRGHREDNKESGVRGQEFGDPEASSLRPQVARNPPGRRSAWGGAGLLQKPQAFFTLQRRMQVKLGETLARSFAAAVVAETNVTNLTQVNNAPSVRGDLSR